MTRKSILIGIAGGTGSGKTSVAKAITRDFSPQEIALVEQDSYYLDQSHLPFEEREKINYDHPHSMDFDLMKTQIKALLDNEPVSVPLYDYDKHTRSGKTVDLHQHHIIVFEGILALYDPELRDMMDIKIYVDTADDVRILRRLCRDVNERGRSIDSITDQYYKTVRPMHQQFIEPTKSNADIIIPEGANNKVAIDVIRAKILCLLGDNNTKDSK